MSEVAHCRLRPGTRVAVTGAARGIGRAVACRFAAEGAHVAVVDVDAAAAAETSRAISGSTSHQLDVSDAEAVQRFFARADEPYEVVVANAGIPGTRASVVQMDPSAWHQVLDVNLTGVFNTIRGAAARMLEDEVQGAIIVTASIAGLTAEPGATAYCASKWGAIGLLKSAAIELAPHGIRVNGVCPGDVETSLFDGMMTGDDYYPGPLGRPAKPEEIAGLYVWLASPDARFMVGEAVVIDGGLASTALIH